MTPQRPSLCEARSDDAISVIGCADLLDDHLPVHPRVRRADVIVVARLVEGDRLRLPLLQYAGVPVALFESSRRGNNRGFVLPPNLPPTASFLTLSPRRPGGEGRVRGADEAVCGAAHLSLPGAIAPGPLPLPPKGPLKGGEWLFPVNLRLRSTARVQSVPVPRKALRRSGGRFCMSITPKRGPYSMPIRTVAFVWPPRHGGTPAHDGCFDPCLVMLRDSQQWTIEKAHNGSHIATI